MSNLLTTTKIKSSPTTGKLLLILLLALACSIQAISAPLGTSFTFQGKLQDNGQPANGDYEFEFILFDAVTGGNAVAPVNTREEVFVTNGVFTVLLDFGAAAFDGSGRWLEIWVRSSNGDSAAVLTPRTPVTPTPQALIANTVLDGAVTAVKLANGSVNGAKILSGSVGSNQLASGSVQAQHIGNGAVGTPQLADGSVTTPKLANGSVNMQKLADGAVTTAKLDNGSVTAEKLADGVIQQHMQSSGQSAVAAGGIIMSEQQNNPALLGAGYTLMGELKLISEIWTNRPSPAGLKLFGSEYRKDHVSVWTGTEMLVWGGVELTNGKPSHVRLNTGWRYRPSTETWLPMNTNGAPSGRINAQAVWTGTELIVWSGDAGTLDFMSGDRSMATNGARYNPATDTWTSLSQVNGPATGAEAKTFWIGTRMLVWGGYKHLGALFTYDEWFNGGGIYNPATDAWTPMTAYAGLEIENPVAVWTGPDMLVWANDAALLDKTNRGLRYNIAGNTWSTISTNNGPGYRLGAVGAWVGNRFLVWGGYNDHTGKSYNPANNTWSNMATNAFVTFRDGCQALSIGQEMLVWGGDADTGARYNPSTDAWTLTAPRTDTVERTGFTSVWTGSDWILWGGRSTDGFLMRSGLRYNANTKTWVALSVTNAPSSRERHTAVWAGSEMIVFGGMDNSGVINTGGRYNPATDTWSSLPTNGTIARFLHSAVWTGNEMLVWGGRNSIGSSADPGMRFNPATGTWATMRNLGGPSARVWHSAVWTGTELIVWGGNGQAGARYNAALDNWAYITTNGAPSLRTNHTAVWTGKEMIICGGQSGTNYSTTVGRYNPASDTWTAGAEMSAGMVAHTAVWAGTRMIVAGGRNAAGPISHHAAYSPDSDGWTPLSSAGTPTPRYGHACTWTGTEALFWGGIYTFNGQFGQQAVAFIPGRTVYLYLRP